MVQCRRGGLRRAMSGSPGRCEGLDEGLYASMALMSAGRITTGHPVLQGPGGGPGLRGTEPRPLCLAIFFSLRDQVNASNVAAWTAGNGNDPVGRTLGKPGIDEMLKPLSASD